MKRRSLRFKMIIGGMLAVLLPIIIIGFSSVSTTTKAVESQGREQVETMARDLAGMTQILLQEKLNIARELSRTDTIRTVLTNLKEGTPADVDTLNAMLGRITKDFGKDYENFMIADASGTVIADSIGGKLKGLSMADRGGFQAAKQGQANISPPLKSKVTGEVLAPIGVPIYSDGGEFIGMVMNGMSMKFISDKITSSKIGKTGYAFMVNKDGLIIAHPVEKNILATNLMQEKGTQALLEKMTAGQTGVDSYVTLTGDRKIAGFAPVALTGWSIAVTQNESEFLAAGHAIRDMILIVGVIFLAIMMVLVLFFVRSISNPINEIIAGLNEGADQVTSASAEISNAGQSLAEGASEQAASIEETSSSLEEMASMTRQNADNADMADNLMKEVNQVAATANDSMSELIESMKEISKASEETSKIIKTIDEIAFQTNLLALNAAVEAARAGEAGAGFAVVADEVRNLAMRAAQAAKNTADLIETTVQKVSQGAGIVTRTNDAFGQVTTNASKVGSLVAEISAASREQAHGIGQVNTAVSEMDKVVQQNAANAEESASAGEEMNAQAMQMKGMVEDLVVLIRGGETVAPVVHQRTTPSPTKKGRSAGPSARPQALLPQRSKKIDPKKIIPLADDDFTDDF